MENISLTDDMSATCELLRGRDFNPLWERRMTSLA